ncbi:ABC transporter substrate-binding protein [Virgibacillus kimchii]
MRVKILLIAVFSLLLIFTAACGDENAGADENDELVIVSWGGAGTEAQTEAWFEPFSEETGIEINVVTPPSASQIKAQVDSGNVEWDIVLFDTPNIDTLINDGDYLEPIPYEEMDQSLLEGMPENSMMEHGIGAYYWGWALTYRSDRFDDPPQNWGDFWDTEQFPGPRTMPDQAHSNMEVALMAMGEDEENIYPIDEAKAQRALDKISEIEPEISTFWNAGAEGVQALADEEAIMGNVFTVQAASLIQDGVPVEIQWNDGIYAMDYWVVPKGQMSDAVIQFFEFISNPERQAALSNILPYGPVHTEALDYVDEDIKENLVTYPENIEQMMEYNNDGSWGAVYNDYAEWWEEWKLELD